MTYPLSLLSSERGKFLHNIMSYPLLVLLRKRKISAEYDVISARLCLLKEEYFCRIRCISALLLSNVRGRFLQNMTSYPLSLLFDAWLTFSWSLFFLIFFWWESRIMYLFHSSQLTNISCKKVSSSLYNVVVPDTVADPGSASQNVKNKGCCSWQ